MAKAFSVELSLREAPSEAQARATTALKQPAAAIGLRLKNQGAGELAYRPRVGFPFLVNLWHHLNREQMTVKFEPGATGGTRVMISGAVAGGRRALAANREHWSEALGAP
ncbi:MAG: hypothetical protein ACLQMH_00440 [Solirubrobacteraceae bacterium]